MKHLSTFLFLILLCCCSTKKTDNTIEESTTMNSSDSNLLAEVNAMPMPDPEPVMLRHYNQADVAKFTIAAIMSQSPKIISVTKAADEYIVSYNRPSDSQRFIYKVKIDGPFAIWGNINGRWRDTPDDERITFSEDGKKLKIMQRFSDGSVDEKLFSK